jgi:branched-chain amino acid transport system ATP-binding protein
MSVKPLLEARNVCVNYGKVEAVRDVSLRVPQGQIVAIVGANGAGKSSLLNALIGSIRSTGEVEYQGEAIQRWSIETRVERGFCLVPEQRALFADLSVSDNLDLGGFAHRREQSNQRHGTREWLLEIFPRLRERLNQRTGTLSGGEQQMLALGRALMSRPRLLMLDEPSLGLAPIIVREIFRVVVSLRERSVSLLVVEQNARLALQVADYCYVLEGGKIALEGPAAELAQDPRIVATYLGSSAGSRGD